MVDKEFKVGDCVRRIITSNTPHIPVGSTGVVYSIDLSGWVRVNWDHGICLYSNDPKYLELREVNPPQAPRHPSSQRFHDFLKQLGDLHDKKMQDYGRTGDPFANVRGSQDWGARPWVGSMIRANDKLKRLQKFATEGKLVNESVMDSFLDLAGYALIAAVLFEEESNRAVPEITK